MGLDCYSRLIVGVPVPDRTVLEPDRETRFACGCGQAWTDRPPKFCPECGGKVTEVEQPPLTAYEQWQDGDRRYDEDRAGLLSVAAVDTCEKHDGPFALGVRVAETDSNRWTEHETCEVQDGAIDAAMTEARAMAKRFGVKGKPRVYLSTYLSY